MPGQGVGDVAGAAGRRAAVVFNPTKVDRSDLAKAVAGAERAAGFAPSLWLPTSPGDPGVGMAKQAVAEGCAVVLGVGGDGTVRAVAEGLRGSGVPLALCPKGTGNLLARNLELTLDNLPESVSTAFTGVARAVDLGVAEWRRVNGEREEHVFVVMAGMGLDAQIMSTTDEELKKKVGMLAYVKVGLEALRRNHRMRLQYRLDDDAPSHAKVHTVLVGNCGSVANNVLLMPDAAVDDGVLDVVAVEPQGRFGWVRVAWKVLVDNAILRGRKSRQGRDRELSYQQCRRIEVWLWEPEEIELDGDHFGEITSVSVRVEPKALQVMMPPGWKPPAAARRSPRPAAADTSRWDRVPEGESTR